MDILILVLLVGLGIAIYRSFVFMEVDPMRPFKKRNRWVPLTKSVVITLLLPAVWSIQNADDPQMGKFNAFIAATIISLLLSPAFEKGYASDATTAFERWKEEKIQSIGGQIIFLLVTGVFIAVGFLTGTIWAFMVPLMAAFILMIMKFHAALALMSNPIVQRENNVTHDEVSKQLMGQFYGIGCFCISSLVCFLVHQELATSGVSPPSIFEVGFGLITGAFFTVISPTDV